MAIHVALSHITHYRYDRLVRLGVLDADELARLAAEVPPQDERALAHSLLQSGRVDRDVLLTEYRVHVEEAVYQLFAWTHGTFTFEPDEDAALEPLFSVSADTAPNEVSSDDPAERSAPSDSARDAMARASRRCVPSSSRLIVKLAVPGLRPWSAA